jgi:hypothetical protein
MRRTGFWRLPFPTAKTAAMRRLPFPAAETAAMRLP